MFSLLGSRPGIGFPAATKKLGLTNKTYQLWHAIEAFCGALTAPTDGDYTSSLPGEQHDAFCSARVWCPCCATSQSYATIQGTSIKE